MTMLVQRTPFVKNTPKTFSAFLSEEAHRYVGTGTLVRRIPAVERALAREEASIAAEKAAKAAATKPNPNPVLDDPYYNATIFFSF